MIFEQPMNEHTRACIRLEYLLTAVDTFAQESSVCATKATIEYLNQTIELLDRPDLRKKFSQELNRQVAYFTKLKSNPSVDGSALDNVIEELQTTFANLQLSNNKFANALRSNEFLNTIRQYQQTPGGLAAYNTPEFQLWLEQSPSSRQNQLAEWIAELQEVRQTSQLLLRLIRQSSNPTPECAESGFFQRALDSQTNCQLVRVEVLSNIKQILFPVISASRHGISIRFNELNVNGHATQCEHAVEFALTCCVL